MLATGTQRVRCERVPEAISWHTGIARLSSERGAGNRRALIPAKHADTLAEALAESYAGPMPSVVIRDAEASDLGALTQIYNHYVVHTAITFDIEPWSVERRKEWFSSFYPQGRHRLFVAAKEGQVLGYACSGRFRAKAAYDTSVESSVYLEPTSVGQGLGTRLYTHLLAALRREDVHRVLAGITLPNEASEALHAKLGFESCGVMHRVGFKFDAYWDVEWLERGLP